GVTEYLDDEETTRRFFRDGYFYSGDIGAFQADGRLVLQGRADNVLNILGYKVAAELLEQRLANKLAFEGVCAFMHEGATEEQLILVIQSRRGIDKDQLKNALRGEMPKLPVTRTVLVTGIPRNEMGKIDRPALRRQIFAAGAIEVPMPAGGG